MIKMGLGLLPNTCKEHNSPSLNKFLVKLMTSYPAVFMAFARPHKLGPLGQNCNNLVKHLQNQEVLRPQKDGHTILQM